MIFLWCWLRYFSCFSLLFFIDFLLFYFLFYFLSFIFNFILFQTLLLIRYLKILRRLSCNNWSRLNTLSLWKLSLWYLVTLIRIFNRFVLLIDYFLGLLIQLKIIFWLLLFGRLLLLNFLIYYVLLLSWSLHILFFIFYMLLLN